MTQLTFFLILSLLQVVLGLTITADSQQVGNEIQLAIDGDVNTFWHSEYSPATPNLPHTVILDLGQATLIYGISYLPRQDGSNHGNIGQYTIELSLTLTNSKFTQVASGTWPDSQSLKNVGFPQVNARYIRITALTEAGGRGPWSSAAEFGFVKAPTSTTNGQWGYVMPMPIVGAGAFYQHGTGKIMTFASFLPDTFQGSGNTYTASFDPSTNTFSEVNVQNTNHDMFCPGMSLDANGRAVVTGGDDADLTSIYDPSSNTWIKGSGMKLPRGYQASATLSDGRIFVIGGSWSGGQGGKNGEIYDPAANKWTYLSGCPEAPMLTNDQDGKFRSDSHAWLFGWKNGYAFQAGPSMAMNWYGTSGTGSRAAAGVRGNDDDAMNGNAVMYDAVNGKIFCAGGSPSYQNSGATNNAHLITLGAPLTNPTVTTLPSMTYKRAFAFGVVLPNGKIMITGGQPYAVPFTDTDAVMYPELWDPVTGTWTILPAHAVPRTYHSIALLMQDGRVFTAGGGLCGVTCATNHEDSQIYSPAYLFNADGSLATRPVVTAISATTLKVGATFTVSMDGPITMWSLIRYGSATHTVDTDQRRVVLTPTGLVQPTYSFVLPNDSGVLIPGYWMLFALNAAGVPSLAKTVLITL